MAVEASGDEQRHEAPDEDPSLQRGATSKRRNCVFETIKVQLLRNHDTILLKEYNKKNL